MLGLFLITFISGPALRADTTETRRVSAGGLTLTLGREWNIESGREYVRATRGTPPVRLDFNVITQTFTDDLAELAEVIVFDELAPTDNSYQFVSLKPYKEIPDTYLVRDKRSIKNRPVVGIHFVIRREGKYYSLRFDVPPEQMADTWPMVEEIMKSLRQNR